MPSSEDRIRMMLQERMDNLKAEERRKRLIATDEDAAMYARDADEIDLDEYRKFERRNGYIQKAPARKDDDPNPPRKMPYRNEPGGKGPYIRKM